MCVISVMCVSVCVYVCVLLSVMGPVLCVCVCVCVTNPPKPETITQKRSHRVGFVLQKYKFTTIKELSVCVSVCVFACVCVCFHVCMCVCGCQKERKSVREFVVSYLL